MVSQSPVGYDPSTMSLLKFAAYILPLDRFATQLTAFPGTNCFEPYGTKGQFFIDLTFYSAGKEVEKFQTDLCDEKGYLEAVFESFIGRHSLGDDAIVICDYHHTKTIPVELYLSTIHRASGVYHAYPALSYAGDKLYDDVHATQLENTLFWPGIVAIENAGTSLIVVNPYKVSLSYQVSLFMPNTERVQTKVIRVKPFSGRVHDVEELFPEHYHSIISAEGQCSLCVAAQHKVICYAMIKERRHGIITTIDHLHNYQLV